MEGIPALGNTHLSACCTCVSGQGLHLCDTAIRVDARRLIGVAHDHDVVTTTERVLEDGARHNVHLRVIAWCLACGGAIIVPMGKVLQATSKQADAHVQNIVDG